MERFIKAGRISAYNMRMLTENIRIPAMIVIVFLFIVQTFPPSYYSASPWTSLLRRMDLFFLSTILPVSLL